MLLVGTFSPQTLHFTTNTCRELEPWKMERAEANLRRNLFTIASTQIEFTNRASMQRFLR